MILAKLSPFFAADLETLRRCAGLSSLWKQELASVAALYERDTGTDALIGGVQAARRLIRIFICKLENNQAFRDQVLSAPLTDWASFAEPPVSRVLQLRLADQLYIVRGRGDVPVLEVGDQARYIGAKLFEHCVKDGLSFDINVHDENFTALLMNAADTDGIEKLAKHFLQTRENITARILVTHNLPRWPVIETDPEKQRLYRNFIKPYREKAFSGAMRSVLTMIPTPKDADVDGLEYRDYAELYFRMCDQPWDLIKRAQGKLIEKLNAGKMLRFTNSDGTDLSMDIDGFTFCNSVIARNIPGSEVFSAPKIDSTQGLIVAHGRFTVKEDAGTVIENLRLRFDKGELIEAIAEKGQTHLDKALSIDAGARRIGEIGIGTNPYLKRHLASILLSEKIGGSFHVALGDAYTMTDYMGDPVRVDNGNRSQLHWDITTMLYGKQGRILLDDTPIMIDGLFTDPILDVLNRGWQSLPFDARPPEWQKIYPSKEAS